MARSVEEEIERGRRAKELFTNELFVEAVRTADETITLQWKQAETVAAREAAFAESRALERVVRNLRAIMDHGTTATAKRERAEKLAKTR